MTTKILVLGVLTLVSSSLGVINSNLLIISLKKGKVLPGLCELCFLHTLSDIPVDKGSLGVHEIKLVVKSGPGFSNSSGVGKHANSSRWLGHISTRGDGGFLVVDTNLETSWAPVDELDGPLGLDITNGSVDILGDYITPVEQTTGHVLSVSGIALHHLVRWLETGSGNLVDRLLLVVGLLSAHDGSIGRQREVDPGVGHQVGLELSQINVEGTIESERSGDGGNDLADKPVEVGVAGSLDIEVLSADIVDGLVVDHEGTVDVFKGSVSGEDCVVGLNDSGADCWCRVDGELEFGLLAVVHAQSLREEGGEAGAGATTERVEDEETLESGTLVSQFPDPVHDIVDDLLPDGIEAPGVVVGGILLATDHLLWMEKSSIFPCPDFVDDSWLKIQENRTWDMFSFARFRKKRREGVVCSSFRLVLDSAVLLDAMFQAVELPAGVTDLGSSLTNMHVDTLSHV